MSLSAMNVAHNNNITHQLQRNGHCHFVVTSLACAFSIISQVFHLITLKDFELAYIIGDKSVQRDTVSSVQSMSLFIIHNI